MRASSLQILAACWMVLGSCPAISQEPTRPQPDAPPAELAGLRYERIVRVPFRFWVKKITNDELTLLRPRSLLEGGSATGYPEEGEVRTFKVGDRFPDDDAMVFTRFAAKTATIQGIIKRVSELSFLDLRTGREYTWVKDQIMESPYTYAVMRTDGAEFHLKLDWEFNYPKGSPTRYKAVKLQEEAVSIRRLSDGREFTIPRRPAGEGPEPVMPSAPADAGPSPGALPAELVGARFMREERRFCRFRVEHIAKDAVTLRFWPPAKGGAGYVETFQAGSRFPDSDYAVTRVTAKAERKGGITLLFPEVGFRHVRTGREFTFAPRYEGDAAAGWAALKYKFSLVRSDGSELRVEEGDEFGCPPDSPTRYKVETLQRESVSVRRLSDDRTFELPTLVKPSS